MAKRIRGFETVGDMLRSLAVVGVFVAVIVGITLRETPAAVTVVDPAPIVAAVAQAAPFAAAVVPGPTPAGWRVTSARVTPPAARPYSWYVGYLTDSGAFVSVTQLYGDLGTYLEDIGADGSPIGTVTINGHGWQELQNPDGSRRALVRTSGDVTTVVAGTAPFPVLTRTAAALRPAKS